MDFKNISDGFTPDNNFNPNLQQQQPQLQTPPTKKKKYIKKKNFGKYPWILFFIDPWGAFSRPIHALFIY